MTDIAIVGMSCRLPGANSVDEYRELLAAGREGLRRTATEFPLVGVTGRVENALDVDAAALGIGDADALVMDPQHRVFIECAKDALDAAGHGADGDRGVVGVYVGAGLSGYLVHNLADRFDATGGADPAGSLNLHTANVADYLPLRVAYLLGLDGPSMAVGATCATSLVAVHVAMQALIGHECDTALAGGVSLQVPQRDGYIHVPEGPFSPDGHTRAYSAGAAGTVFTDGVGCVVLRRLEDATRDGDRIHAVIRGSAVTNDGADKVGFTAPTIAGQVAAIEQALAMAQLDPSAIGLVEGHGTATALGDRIEIAALRQVSGPAATPWCALGSAKTNVGHTSSAAGVAGLIKAVLSVRDGVIFGTLHADPVAELEGSAYYLPTATRRWDDEERRAGVSSFGIGGVNCHVIVEQPPAAHREDDRGPGTHLITVSAATASAAEAWLATTHHRVAAAACDDAAVVADAAALLAHGRAEMPQRAFAVVDERGALHAQGHGRAAHDRIVLAFPGASAQRRGMLRGPIAADPGLRAHLNEVAEAICEVGGVDVLDLLLGESDEPLPDPAVGLPALFAAEVAAALRLSELGLRPDAVVGHSVGEYAAAVVAGGLSLAEAARLVVARSQAMARTEPGRMLAVGADEATLTEILASHPDVDLAAVNGPHSCVVAGAPGPVEVLAEDLTRAGVRNTAVGIDVAAHSRLMEPARAAIDAAAASLRPQELQISLHSTLQGRAVTQDEWRDTQRWGAHLCGTVRFADALASAIGGTPSVVLSCGPGSTVAISARAVGGSAVTATVSPFADEPDRDFDSARDGATAYVFAIGELWASGGGIDLGALTGPVRRRLELPTYPYERRRVYVEPQKRTLRAAGPAGDAPSAAEPLQVPTWRGVPPPDGAKTPEKIAVLGSRHLGRGLGSAEHRFVKLEEAEAVVVAIDTTRGSTERERLADALLQLGEVARRLSGATTRLADDAVLPAVYVDMCDAARPDAVAAAVAGAVRVLGQEVPGLRWRLVQADDAALDGGLVGAELADLTASGETGWEVRLRGAERSVRTWQPWRPRVSDAPPVARGGTVLITGGLGAVGLLLAERWGTRDGARIVLASRRAGDLHLRDDERSREQRAAIDALRARGIDLELATLDVAEANALHDLIARLTAERGRIDLVVHAPVALELASLAELDEDLVAANLAAKVGGAAAIEAALDRLDDRQRPNRVVLMSSAAGAIGGFGLAAYVAASRYLDEVARRRHAQGWIALDWDRWRFGTAAEAEAVAEITMRNALDASDAVRAFDRVLRVPAAPPHIAISPGPLDPRSIALPQRAASTAGGAEDLRTPAETLVAQVWSEVLGTRIANRDDDFFARGGHSLLATRVLAALRERTGTTLKLRDLLRASTVAALAALLGGAKPDQVKPDDDDEESAIGDISAKPRVSAPFGLTRVQTAYLLGRQESYDLGGVACQFHLEVACPGIDVDRYAHAWRTVVRRHEMLRTVIDRAGRNHPLDPPPDAALRIHDLTAEDPGYAYEVLGRLRDSAAHRVADPHQWPLVEPIVVLMPDQEHRLLISVDVLVCDSASWMLIDREMRAIYENPTVELPPVPLTFADCVAELERRSGSAERREAWAYWERRLDSLPPAPEIQNVGDPDIPEKPVDSRPRRARFTRRRAVLDARTWGLVRDAAGAQGVGPTSAILAAYADILAKWSGQEHFSITTTVFDRPDIPGVENVVGEFSSLLILEREPQYGADLIQKAAALQRRLHADLVHSSVSGLEVLAEQARRTGRQRNVPVVFTSMVGLDVAPDGTEHDTEWLGEIVDGVSQTPQTWLDHQAFEHRGELVLQWDVNEAAVDPMVAGRMFEQYVSLLRGMSHGDTLRTVEIADIEPETREGVKVTVATEALDVSRAEGLDEVDEVLPVKGERGYSGDLREDARDAYDDAAAQVRDVWSEILNISADQVGMDDHFLALGGDSLLAVRMASILAERTGSTLPLTAVRSDVTVADVVAALRSNGDVSQEYRQTTDDQHADVDGESAQSTTFPMTSLQRAYWLGQQASWGVPATPASVVTLVPLRGVCAERAAKELERAMQALVLRHPMLRVRITDDAEQVIRDREDPSVRPRVDVVDARAATDSSARLPGLAARRAADSMAASWAREVPDLDHEPAVRAGLVLDEDGRALLLTRYSLLAIDGWSTALIERDLARLLRGAPVGPAVDARVVGENLRAATSQRREDLQWWRERLADRPEAPALPETGCPATGVMMRREARLDPELHRALGEHARAAGVTPSAAVTAVIARALRAVTGQDRMLLTTLHSRRESGRGDALEMVGPLSTTALLDVDLGRDAGLADQARRIGRAFGDISAHLSVSAIDVGRALASGADRARALAPFVVQSTLGMEATSTPGVPMGVLGHAEPGRLQQRVQTPHIHGEFRVFALDGELVVDLALREGMFSPELADRLIAQAMTTLRELTAGVGWADPVSVRPAAALEVTRQAAASSSEDGLLGSVLAAWRDVLGCDVDPDDDFFDLGGDSLQMIRMLRSCGADAAIDPGSLLEAPTARRLARLLATAMDDRAYAANTGSPIGGAAAARAVEELPREGLVRLKAGTGAPVFLIHPSGGDVSCYLPIARLLRAKRPIVAIADPGLSGHPWPTDLTEVIRRYAAVIEAEQPSGSITLGGWSMGGTLAHAIAVHLRRRGRSVERLVMIDSTCPERIVAIEGLNVEQTTHVQRMRFLRSIQSYLGLRTSASDPDTLQAELVELGAFTDNDAAGHRFAVFDRHLRGLAEHLASRLDGTVPVLLIRADDRSPHNGRLGMGVDDALDDDSLGWRPYVDGDLDVRSAPGHHYSVIRDEGARVVAAELDRILAD